MKLRISHVLISTTLFTLSAATYAVAPGFYMGLMAGPAANDASNRQAQMEDSALTVTAKPRANQFGSRIYAGYKYNPFIGMEAGLTYFSTLRYDTSDVPTCSSTNVRVRDFDFLLRGSIPFHQSFEAYAKGGVAVIYQTTSGALNPGATATCGKTYNTVQYRPTASVGASYNLNQNWVADISWNRLMVGNFVKNIDFYAFGISYHFVNRYCGQFLCDE